jgi:hypothetical protein
MRRHEPTLTFTHCAFAASDHGTVRRLRTGNPCRDPHANQDRHAACSDRLADAIGDHRAAHADCDTLCNAHHSVNTHGHPAAGAYGHAAAD